MVERNNTNSSRKQPDDKMELEQKINQSDRISEEPVIDTDDSWLLFTQTPSDLFKSRFHVAKYLYDEQQSITKMITSKKVFSKTLAKSQKKYYPNELFLKDSNHKGNIYQTFIPNKLTYAFEGIGSRIYNANFDLKGERFFATSQSGTAIFNASESTFKLITTINCSSASWALTDSDFTEDNRYMVHSTLSPNVQLFDIENQKHLAHLNMDSSNEDDETSFFYYSFRLFSAKISGDGKQVIAGTSRSLNGKARLQVYDVEGKKLLNSINAHENDINTLSYVDKKSSTLIITGSDDGLCKLWDTRALESSKPACVFYGHLSGITYVSSKEDTRYFISNSKDQSIKLWDLRKSRSEEKQYHHFGFDYRLEKLSTTEIAKIKRAMKQNVHDDSVATFFGHSVYVTLIRCHFSPNYNTDQRFIYSGSSDGSVYIYDILTTQLVARLEATQDKIIRDCAWHPTTQTMITTDFTGNLSKWDHFEI